MQKKKDLFELQPLYDSRASFYKKAYYQQTNDTIILYSYDTDVAIVKNKKMMLSGGVRTDLLFSNTTLRHLKEFYYQFVSDDKKITINDLKNLERF